MKTLFSLDNPVIAFLGRIADLIILSILWGICSIPIVTIGPATTALYYVTLKMVKNDEGSVIKSFFQSFKLNFKQGVLLTLFLLVSYAILFFVYKVVLNVEGVFGTVLLIFFLISAICILGATIYSFPLLAKFDNTIGKTLKNAVLLSFQYLFSTILFIFLNGLPLIFFLISPKLFSIILPICFLLDPALIAYMCSIRLSKIFDIQIQST